LLLGRAPCTVLGYQARRPRRPGLLSWIAHFEQACLTLISSTRSVGRKGHVVPVPVSHSISTAFPTSPGLTLALQGMANPPSKAPSSRVWGATSSKLRGKGPGAAAPWFFPPGPQLHHMRDPRMRSKNGPFVDGKRQRGGDGKEGGELKTQTTQPTRQTGNAKTEDSCIFRSQNIPTADGNPEQKTLVIATRGINLNRHFTTTQYAILPPPSCHARDSSIHRPSCPVPPQKRNGKKKSRRTTSMSFTRAGGHHSPPTS
jgi:hypothetical protein